MHPSPREISQTTGAVWTGTEVIVWGGFNGNFLFSTGSRCFAAIRSHPHANSDSYAYSNPNAVHGQMHTNAKAASHSSAAALAARPNNCIEQGMI